MRYQRRRSRRFRYGRRQYDLGIRRPAHRRDADNSFTNGHGGTRRAAVAQRHLLQGGAPLLAAALADPERQPASVSGKRRRPDVFRPVDGLGLIAIQPARDQRRTPLINARLPIAQRLNNDVAGVRRDPYQAGGERFGRQWYREMKDRRPGDRLNETVPGREPGPRCRALLPRHRRIRASACAARRSRPGRDRREPSTSSPMRARSQSARRRYHAGAGRGPCSGIVARAVAHWETAAEAVTNRLLVQNGPDRVGRRVAPEHHPPRKILVQDATEGKDFTALVHRFSAGLLRAHVRGGAKDHARNGRRADLRRRRDRR